MEPLLGANGTGKSTLWGTLCWTLFDRYPNGLRSTSLASWGSGRGDVNAAVMLDVEGDSFVVSRTWNPNALLIDGDKSDQKEVDDLIQTTMSGFLNSVYIGQSLRTFMDLSPSEREQMLSTVMGLEAWNDRRAFASKRARKLKDEVASQETEIGRLTGKIEAYQSNDYNENIRKWNAKKRKAERNSARTRSTLIERLERSEKRLKNLLDQVEDFREIVDENNDNIKKVIRFLDEVSRNKESLRLLYTTLRDEHKEESRQLSLFKDSRCPTCDQEVKSKKRDELISKSKRTIEKLDRALDETVDEGKRVSNREIILSDYKEELIESRNEEDGALRELLKDGGEAKTEVDRLVSEIDRIDQEIKEFLGEENPWEEEKRRNTQLILAAKLDLSDAKEKCDKLRTLADATEYWISGFASIRLELVGRIVKRLEEESSLNLSYLGMDGWRVEFSMDRETKSGSINKGFHAFVRSPDDGRKGISDVVPFEAWSGGESQRLRLAVAMSTSDLIQDSIGTSWNLEVYDEPCSWLSSEGVDHVLEALHQRALRLGKVIFVVDHRSLHSGNFSARAVVRKTTDGSIIEWET